MTSSSSTYSLTELIPRLFPFFRHTISSVRLAVVQTITVFLNLLIEDINWVDDRLLRLLFQNLIVEERLDIRDASALAWEATLRLNSLTAHVPSRAAPHLSSWFEILVTPIGTGLDARLFWSTRTSLSGQGAFVYNVDKAILAQDLSLVSAEAVMRGRTAGAKAFGQLMAAWPSEVRLLDLLESCAG
jgi:TATA-binding protein-associated factor